MLTTAQAVRENKKRKKQPGGRRNPSPVGSSPPSLMVEMEMNTALLPQQSRPSFCPCFLPPCLLPDCHAVMMSTF